MVDRFNEKFLNFINQRDKGLRRIGEPKIAVFKAVLVDFGAEFDARLEIELESVRCATAELEQNLVLISNLFPSDELIFDESHGLDQDLRLRYELSDARDVVASFSTSQPSEGKMLRSLIAQESRDASMLSEFRFGLNLGVLQDLRLGTELSASRVAAMALSAR